MIILDKINLTELKINPENPRRITNFQLNNLRRSISEYGFIDPIIINSKTKMIIGGHQRFKVLRENNVSEAYIMNLGDISWVFTDDDLEVVDDNYEKGMNISLNKISGEWDNEKLSRMNINIGELLEDYDEEVSSPIEKVESNTVVEGFKNSYTITFKDSTDFDKWLWIIDYIIYKYPDLNTPVEKIIHFIEEEIL